MSDMNRGNLKPNVIFPELQEVIKQQDEQIKELEGLLSGSKMMNDEAIEQMQQKDQHIEELEKVLKGIAETPKTWEGDPNSDLYCNGLIDKAKQTLNK